MRTYLQAVAVKPFDGDLCAIVQGTTIYPAKAPISYDAGCRPALAGCF